MTKPNSKPKWPPRMIGYARVSTREQNLQMQIDDLLAAGVHEDNLWVEKVSGVSSRRPKRDLAIIDAREGDTFVVWRLDRLGRNAVDLYTRVAALESRGVKFRSLRENFDTSTAVGKLMFGMFAVFAQFERDLTVERTVKGMASARERGRKPGAQPKMTPPKLNKAREMLKTKTVAEVAKRFGVAPNTIYTYFPSVELDKLRSGK